MALRYQGTEPKVIVYNGNSNVEEVCIKNGANATPVYVWGKPFNCTCTVTVGSGAAGVDTTLSRLSSPYEGASEGNYVVTRKNGTSNTVTVHKGDRVQISFMTDDSDCEIVSANVYNKGTAVTTEVDAYMAYSDTFSVNGDVVCSVTTKKNETWNTIWTGSENISGSSSTRYFDVSMSVAYTSKLRVTATCAGNTAVVYNDDLPYTFSGTVAGGTIYNEMITAIERSSSSVQQVAITKQTGSGADINLPITITKIELYE